MSWLLDLTNDEASSNSTLPAGKYNVVCEEASVKSTKDGSGEYINVMFNVIDEEFKGRKIFTMFNIKNKNEQAVTIGRQQLKSFLVASGTQNFALTTVSQLHGLRAKVTVKVKTDEYGEKNVVTGFASADALSSVTDSSIPF